MLKNSSFVEKKYIIRKTEKGPHKAAEVKEMPFFILFIIILFLVIANIKVVSQQQCLVIERLGKYHSTWDAGIHVKVPFLDKIVSHISLKEQVLDFPPQNVITKDNVTMTIDSVVYIKVVDPKKYTYGVNNPILALQNLTATTLRSIIGEMELDATLSSRQEINAQMQTVLDEATDEWGLKVTRVEIKSITPPKEIEEVMTKQMRAERDRRETILQAQAHKESVVAMAEGDRQAKVLAAEAERDAQIALAEGRAKSIELVYNAEAKGIQQLAGAGIDENVLKLKSIEAMKDVADGQATKIFIPNDLGSTISSLGVVGEMVNPSPVSPSIPRKQLAAQEVKRRAEHIYQNDKCSGDPDSNAETLSAARVSARLQAKMPHMGYGHSESLSDECKRDPDTISIS